MYTCIYCNSNYDINTEHVFPLGLGGENIMMDCVCSSCNNAFSNLERELYQKSPVALMRSCQGIVGNKSRNAISAFKAPILLCQDDITKVVYEVGQSESMQVYIRPQIMQINDVFYVETDQLDNLNTLMKKFKAWKYSNLRIVIKLPESKQKAPEFVQIEKIDNKYSHTSFSEQLKIKNEIFLNQIPNSHHLHKFMDPRIYLDECGNLKIRARTKKDAVKFILALLKFSDSKKLMTSYAPNTENMKEISVGFNFDSKKSEQGLVKITLNTIFHYYPAARSQTVMHPYLDFVNSGDKKFLAGLERKNSILDSGVNTHNIFLYQSKTFLRARISLFNGQVAYQFFIPGLNIMEQNRFTQVIVDYKLNKNLIRNHIIN
jgi:hypothetical protein